MLLIPIRCCARPRTASTLPLSRYARLGLAFDQSLLDLVQRSPPGVLHLVAMRVRVRVLIGAYGPILCPMHVVKAAMRSYVKWVSAMQARASPAYNVFDIILTQIASRAPANTVTTVLAPNNG